MPPPSQAQAQNQGKCIDFTKSTFANGFVNIAVDAIMVSMPVYKVVQLKLSWKKRIGVVIMFAVGLVYVSLSKSLSFCIFFPPKVWVLMLMYNAG